MNAQTNRVLFQTDLGDIKVLLYDFTPNHRDLILKSIADSVYANALFNRVIEGFVVQGGEHDSDIEKREAADSMHRKPRLSPEFDERAIHKIGALGAGRDDNLEKASFLDQLYFIVGKSVSEDDLNKIEEKKGKKFSNTQREIYLKSGGQPRLDGDYTVFGEIYEGLDVLIKMSKVKTNSTNYPLSPIKFNLIKMQ